MLGVVESLSPKRGAVDFCFRCLFSLFHPDFPCPPKRSHRKGRHCDRICNGEPNHPDHRPHSPLPPCCRQPINSKYREKHSHSFVKQLPRYSPKRAHRRHRRTPEQRHNPRIHAPDSIAFCPIGQSGCPSLASNVSGKQRRCSGATLSTGQVTSAGRIARRALFRSCSEPRIGIGRAFHRR